MRLLGDYGVSLPADYESTKSIPQFEIRNEI